MNIYAPYWSSVLPCQGADPMEPLVSNSAVQWALYLIFCAVLLPSLLFPTSLLGTLQTVRAPAIQKMACHKTRLWSDHITTMEMNKTKADNEWLLTCDSSVKCSRTDSTFLWNCISSFMSFVLKELRVVLISVIGFVYFLTSSSICWKYADLRHKN